MQTIVQEKFDIKILKLSSPVPDKQAWQMESFLLKIFEYGDYSFRKALAGKLHRHLQCTFFFSKNNGSILAAAGSLYSLDNPAVAIMGPVCTAPMYRKKGIACQACGMLLEHLKAQKTQAVYLGVKDNIPVVNLYKKIGFTKYSGVVMRKLFVNKDDFDRRYSSGQQTIVRRIDWRDFAEVSALFCEPAAMYSFDFCRRIFSAMYVEHQKFLPVFPDLMDSLEKNGGCGSTLQTKEHSSIVGAAFIKGKPSKTQSHIAFLEFFVLDGFLDKAKDLVIETIKQSDIEGNRTILCYCLNCDINKKQILLSLGAESYAALPGFIRIKNKLQDTIIYKLTRKL
jgi:ribosomal protein S18 acetylase RimI-like enzyme